MAVRGDGLFLATERECPVATTGWDTALGPDAAGFTLKTVKDLVPEIAIMGYEITVEGASQAS